MSYQASSKIVAQVDVSVGLEQGEQIQRAKGLLRISIGIGIRESTHKREARRPGQGVGQPEKARLEVEAEPGGWAIAMRQT